MGFFVLGISAFALRATLDARDAGYGFVWVDVLTVSMYSDKI